MKHLIRFLVGGSFYLLVEFIWRIVMHHGDPAFVIVPMAGIVCVAVLGLDDRGWHPLLSSLVGALITTLLELCVGAICYYCFDGLRFWQYGRITFKGFIAPDWSLIWWGVCLALVLVRRACQKRFGRRKGNDDAAV